MMINTTKSKLETEKIKGNGEKKNFNKKLVSVEQREEWT